MIGNGVMTCVGVDGGAVGVCLRSASGSRAVLSCCWFDEFFTFSLHLSRLEAYLSYLFGTKIVSFAGAFAGCSCIR